MHPSIWPRQGPGSAAARIRSSAGAQAEGEGGAAELLSQPMNLWEAAATAVANPGRLMTKSRTRLRTTVEATSSAGDTPSPLSMAGLDNASTLPPDTLTRAPLVPEWLLSQHRCLIVGDTRYRAALRARQGIWRRERGLAIGLHRPGGRRDVAPVPLGSLLHPADAVRGMNFASAELFAYMRRTLATREEGACLSLDRLMRNLLSSEALAFNAFGPLGLDLDLASTVFRRLMPHLVDRVLAITYETAPARRTARFPNDRYLSDRTAFDIALRVDGPGGETTIFVEIKLSEACQGPAAAHRPRYDEASREVGLHHDPDDPALRSVQLEQFWRLHCLAALAVRHGVTPRAHLLTIYPELNRHVRTAVRLYASTLREPAGSAMSVGFSGLTLEAFVAVLDAAGAAQQSTYLRDRYLDLRPVLDLVLDPESLPPEGEPPAGASRASSPPVKTDTVSLMTASEPETLIPRTGSDRPRKGAARTTRRTTTR